jgi:predicted YcjX-like family ATPase
MSKDQVERVAKVLKNQREIYRTKAHKAWHEDDMSRYDRMIDYVGVLDNIEPFLIDALSVRGQQG